MAVQPAAVTVIVHRIDLVSYDGDTVTLTLDCSAGFYVRSLASDLGRLLGTGAHLTRLRRTRSGSFSLDRALPLAEAERDQGRAVGCIIPMSCMLPDWSAVIRRAITGRDIGPADIQASPGPADRPGSGSALVRLVDAAGDLVGAGEPSATPGVLHPSVVLR